MARPKSEISKDEAVIRVLDSVVRRPVFINLHYTVNQFTLPDLTMMLPDKEDTKIEVVGSSNDGLKVGKVFDVGDIDALMMSNTFSFYSTDESTFEYNPDDPCFLSIPRPQKLSNLPASDGKYLNANFLRVRHPELFRSEVRNIYRYIPFTLMPSTASIDPTKCAITAAVSYSDPVLKDNKKASEFSVDHRVLVSWHTEHALLAHLLLSSNRGKLESVKELLFGGDIACTKTTYSQLKTCMIMWKQDFQRNMFNIYDMLYFKSKEFREVLSEATDPEISTKLAHASITDPHGEYSVDLVPAIKCSGWPKPALSFKTRERKWPLGRIVDDIIKQGFQIVAKSPQINPHPETDFILSFSPAEQQLARALPANAKTAYSLFKLCFKCANEQLPGEENNSLKTFHLKTALFWVAERTLPESWDDNDTLWGIRAIALFLIESLKKRNLPSFFVPSNNLIRHLSTTETEKASAFLQLIHDNPANFIQLVIEKEWKFSRVTMPEDSFQKVQQSGYYDQFSWLEQIKVYCYALGSAGNYPLGAMMDNMSTWNPESFFKQYVQIPFRAEQSGNTSSVCDITDDQLRYVDIFVQTVTQKEMDLFKVLDFKVEEEIINASDEWISKETLELYPQYDAKADEKFGELFLATIRLRLKFYANIFHYICSLLAEARNIPQQRNADAVYIINFLNQLKQRRGFTEENIEDLLHYMFYFCHYTRLRHHNFHIDEQILRSMREFLEDPKQMMTIYFNPRETYPIPVDIKDKIETVLGERFQRKEQESQCIID